VALPLEQKLVGLEEGQQAAFELSPAEGFGERNAELVQTITRAAFDKNADPSVEYAPGDVVEFNLPARGRLAGVLKSRDGALGGRRLQPSARGAAVALFGACDRSSLGGRRACPAAAVFCAGVDRAIEIVERALVLTWCADLRPPRDRAQHLRGR